MTIQEPRYPGDPQPVNAGLPMEWTPVIAGAIAAAALAFVLHTFAAAVGLAVSSTAPTWRDSSVALWILSGVYLILVAVASYGLGGYLAGRLRARLVSVAPEELEMRDGANGLLSWALATLITGMLVFAAANSVSRLTASSNAPGSSQSVAGESTIAYELDRLLRTDRRAPDADYNSVRAEAARILLMSSSHSGVSNDDRAYLTRLVAARTGLSAPDAERRVETAIANARTSISRARRSGVILAFMAGAAALLGAAVAWFAACAGGRHRDAGVAPPMTWKFGR